MVGAVADGGGYGGFEEAVAKAWPAAALAALVLVEFAAAADRAVGVPFGWSSHWFFHRPQGGRSC